jgi:capsular polysaccharide biosynthesis protein
MNLYDLIKFYGRQWRVIVLLTLTGILAGLVYNNFIQVPLYQSNAKLLLITTSTSTSASNQTLINNYINLISSRKVLEPVAQKQDNAISYEKLLSSVKAVNQKDTAVIDITVTTNNSQQSADIANDVTESFRNAVKNLYKNNGFIVVDPAVKATNPINNRKAFQLIIAAVSGFVISLVALFIAYDFSDIKKTSKSKSRAKGTKNLKKKIAPKKVTTKKTTPKK